MNIPKNLIAGLAAVVAVVSWMQTSGSKSNAGVEAQTVPSSDQGGRALRSGSDRSAVRASGTAIAEQSGQPLPFTAALESPQTLPMNAGGAVQPGNAAAANKPDKDVISPEEAARRKKMEQLGYMVPADYYQKNLATLRQLAQRGDAYALVHLGEKYYFELNGQKSNPEFDPAINYPDAAKKSFSEALAVGNIRSAGIISEIYLQENNAVDAYAWHLLSKRLGDDISAAWFEKTALYASLSEQQKLQAQSKLPDLVNNINELSIKYKVKPVF